MASIITVPYTILINSGIAESNPAEGPAATVVFKCLWDDHYQLIQDLLGTWVRVGRSVARTVPFRYPFSQNLLCHGISSIEPHGKAYIPRGFTLPWVAKKYALVTADFSVLTYEMEGPSAYTTITFQASGEFLTLPETTYQFADGTPTGTPIGQLIPQLEITLQRHRMPFVPVQEMFSLQGQINHDTYSIFDYEFPAGTLLFMPGTSTVEADTAGNLAYTCEYKFIAKPMNWNKFIHPNRTTGFALVTDGDGNSPYESGDFEILP